jgi:transaldolase/glucose-6-phosphate isomerase
VSLEVSPHLAHDTGETIAEARRLWDLVDRPNVMIKVPATLEGLPAIQHLIGEGINVNVTLLFGLPRYRLVADAYIKGLEKRAARGEPLKHVASVASFFLSRIDVMVDPMLEKMIAEVAAMWSRPVSQGTGGYRQRKVASEIHKEIFRRTLSRPDSRAPGPNGFCGPVPARRTRNTATLNTSSH